jgi:CS domain
MGPSVGKPMASEADQEVIGNMRKEQIFRKYPFEESLENLPILPDCNNYYSGKFGEYAWHQNADQVYVYIPVDESVSKRDVDVKFEALSVTVNVDDKEVTKFATLERIIPDGSFWTFETDKNGKKYLQLDLEKRLRMINWKNLFGEAQQGVVDNEAENRQKMLEKLFSANKGMSKLTGKEPETIADMMKNKELMDMLEREVNEKPQYIDGDDDRKCTNPEDDLDFVCDNPFDKFDVQKIVKEAADKIYGPETIIDTTAEDAEK